MISVILPAYNEEKNIGPSIDDISRFLNSKNISHEIIVVNDGSKDKTGEILLNRKNITLINHASNSGYGAALRSGFSAAKGDLIFFTDSDRQFDIKDLDNFLEIIKDYDFVVGYRQNRQDPAIRILYAKIFGLMAWIFFGVKIKDLDCAFKLFKNYAIKNLNLTENGALINLEIFALAKKSGYKFAEIPVQHFERKAGSQTGGNFKVVFRAMINFLKLWMRTN